MGAASNLVIDLEKRVVRCVQRWGLLADQLKKEKKASELKVL